MKPSVTHRGCSEQSLASVGLDDGEALGLIDGNTVGLADGVDDGEALGSAVGKLDGLVDGAAVGAVSSASATISSAYSARLYNRASRSAPLR